MPHGNLSFFRECAPHDAIRLHTEESAMLQLRVR